jgi:acyl-CoA reductase-like NAD-dependent aldehyde dehydrogenase
MSIAEQKLWIGGQWVPAEGGKTFESLDPFTGRPTTRAAAATVADVDRGVQAAQDAFGPWSALPPSKRRAHLSAAVSSRSSRSARSAGRAGMPPVFAIPPDDRHTPFAVHWPH